MGTHCNQTNDQDNLNDISLKATYVRGLQVALVRFFKRVGRVVLPGALVDVESLQIHSDSNDAFELQFCAQRIPAEERRGVREHPLLHESLAIEIGARPVTVA